MGKKVLIVLAEGFEEIEALAPVDIFRRSGLDVTIAGIGGTQIKGSRNVVINADILLADYDAVPDAIVFPGGAGGAENLASSSRVKDLIRSVNSKGNIIAAICASPAVVLAPTGILDGKKATCYPGMEEHFPPEVKAVEENVVEDGNVITSKGPATAIQFALKIVERLLGKDTAESVGKAVLLYD